MQKILVIGAGIVGASVAYGLARRGASVTVLEATRPAAGTSRTSFAWPNANEKLPREYFALNAAGLAEHHRLAGLPHPQFYPLTPFSRRNLLSIEDGEGSRRERSAALSPSPSPMERGTWGEATWFHQTGNLEIITDAGRQAHQREKVARLREWGYAAELVSEARAHELAPDLRLPDGASFAFYPDEGWVAAPVLTHYLLEAARAAGAQILYPRRVTALETVGGRVSGVVARGERIAADWVVDCAGPAATELLGPLGFSIARRRSRGLLVVTEPLSTGLARVVHGPGVHLRPDGAGRVLIGSEDVDALLPDQGDLTADADQCQEMLRRARTILPVVGDARLEGIRLGWRPMPADGLSAVGVIPDLAGYYLVFTHSGVTLGPMLGQLVAEELTTGAARPELATFRPDRLLSIS